MSTKRILGDMASGWVLGDEVVELEDWSPFTPIPDKDHKKPSKHQSDEELDEKE